MAERPLKWRFALMLHRERWHGPDLPDAVSY